MATHEQKMKAHNLLDDMTNELNASLESAVTGIADAQEALLHLPAFVQAPDGYEGLRCFDKVRRQWEVSCRRMGDSWWTVVGFVGHRFLTKEELDARAANTIVRHIAKGA